MDAIRCAYKILDYLEQSIERSDVDYKDISAERLGVSNQMHTTVILGLLDLGHVFGAVRVSQYIGLHFFLKDVRPMLPPVMNHSIAVA